MSGSPSSGALLPHLSTFAVPRAGAVVYFCCTFPEVAFGGRYPLSLPCGARTFLTDGLSALPARLSSLVALSIITERWAIVKWLAKIIPNGYNIPVFLKGDDAFEREIGTLPLRPAR